jgi:serine/threonine protein phosphatase 1
MELIPADPETDTLVFIGDYIDRSPDGRGVVDYILKLKKTHAGVVCLCGNHELMLMNFLEGVEEDLYLANGGRMTLAAYGINRQDTPGERRSKIPKAHWLFFKSLLPYYETEQYIFVHAGMMPGFPLCMQSFDDLIWIRNEFIDSDYDFGKRVVFGHTHLPEPLVLPNKIGIDTGAVYGGKLTCVELPAVKFYQV